MEFSSIWEMLATDWSIFLVFLTFAVGFTALMAITWREMADGITSGCPICGGRDGHHIINGQTITVDR